LLFRIGQSHEDALAGSGKKIPLKKVKIGIGEISNRKSKRSNSAPSHVRSSALNNLTDERSGSLGRREFGMLIADGS